MISIVMPVRNALPYLTECLESIQTQTYTNWELIAVNDHSTDDSYQELKRFESNDKRIHIFNNTGKGIIDALKLAYSKSTGNYITRMDADDIMPERKLELLRSKLIEHPGTVSTGKIKYIGENLREGYQKYENWMNALIDRNSHYDEIYRECVIPSPAWMMDRELFESIDAFNPDTYPEDYDLTLRIYQAGIPITGATELVHIWRDYSERTSRNDPHYAFNAFEALKTDYFLKVDHDPDKILVLWGGGKKGKNIALLLQKHNVKFTWACNNPKKIGQDIYGLKMYDIETIFKSQQDYQTIVAVAQPEEQVKIKKHLLDHSNIEAHWFC